MLVKNKRGCQALGFARCSNRTNRAPRGVGDLHTSGVTTLLTEPHETLTPAAPSRRSRRWRWGLALMVGLVLAAVAAAGGWLLAYQPIRGGEVGGADAPTIESIDTVLGSEYRVVAPSPGDTITLFVSLRNDGPLGVTIVGVEQPFNADGVVDRLLSAESTTPARLEIVDAQTGLSSPADLPFALEPGAAVEARVSFDVLECATELGAPGSINWSTSLPMTYSVLGMERAIDLDIGYAIAIESLPSCPSV